MKNLLVLGLLVLGLSSCGQSLDTTKFEDDGGTEHNTGTNYNKIQDIQDCLNGDRPACQRAIAEGFIMAPLFLEDLKEVNELVVTNEDGLTKSYTRSEVYDGLVIFGYTRSYRTSGGRNYNIRTEIWFHEDFEADIVTKYSWSQGGYSSGWLAWGTHNSTFNNEFHMLSDSNLEWKSHDSKSVHVELIGNIEVN